MWTLPEVWTPLLVAVLFVVVFLYGVSKTAMPVAGVLASPLIVAALTPTTATGFTVPLLIIGDFIALGLYRQHADWRLIRKLVPGVLLGFLITALLFRFLSIEALSRIVGVLILSSVGLEVWRQRREGADHRDLPEMSNKGVIIFFGALAGVTSMAANAGGTAMSLYLVKMRVSMLVFMGTSTWFFFVLNSLKVPFAISLGLITPASLWADLWFLPVLVVGAIAGVVIFRRMSQVVFVRVALSLSALGALWLIVRG